MKLLKLTSLAITPVKAQVYKNPRNGKLYYNIQHGTKGDNLFVWTCGLTAKHFTPEDESSILELDGDNYVLKNITDNNKQPKKDPLGNYLYTIDIDFMEQHKNEKIVLWEIPNKKYVDVKYTLEGDCDEIGKGITGKTRGMEKYISPAPVLEIYGDTKLSWIAVGHDGKKYTQTIQYDYVEDKWTIPPVKIIDEK